MDTRVRRLGIPELLDVSRLERAAYGKLAAADEAVAEAEHEVDVAQRALAQAEERAAAARQAQMDAEMGVIQAGKEARANALDEALAAARTGADGE